MTIFPTGAAADVISGFTCLVTANIAVPLAVFAALFGVGWGSPVPQQSSQRPNLRWALSRQQGSAPLLPLREPASDALYKATSSLLLVFLSSYRYYLIKLS